ncbi:hypothetical protein [Sinorhizobium meliloti]|uniref:hypothetical protein n=1 Tax=Rhizobium meliloti TaxID=382 RepID=UPI001F2D7704|nr:hypothetical protein [Sinorhizobium meliloti]
MSDLPKPKYRWRQTWRDAPKHFSGYDGGRHIASIHWYHMGWWNWFMCWNQAKNSNRWKRPNGQAETAREAALEAEKCYEAVLGCKWPGMAPDDLQSMLDKEEWQKGYKKLWEDALAEKGCGPDGKLLRRSNARR